MKPRPGSAAELGRMLVELRQSGGRFAGVDWSGMTRVLAHHPEDMTITVEAGMTVKRLQEQAALGGQWLPVDPPHPELCTVGALIAGNVNGSRRYGYGTVREHLIGLGVVLADGRLVRSGGRVVKNVAGYDLQKLFVGSAGTLGLIVEATFKLWPKPETERRVQARCASLAEAGDLVERVVAARLAPVLMDLHNLAGDGDGGTVTLELAFAGALEFVDHQVACAARLGIGQAVEEDVQRQFWSEETPAWTHSVLPSRTVEFLAGLGGARWLAHAGNGVIHYRGGASPPRVLLPWGLMAKIKRAFDPTGFFPELAGGPA